MPTVSTFCRVNKNCVVIAHEQNNKKIKVGEGAIGIVTNE